MKNKARSRRQRNGSSVAQPGQVVEAVAVKGRRLLAVGTSSCASSSRFGPSSALNTVTPVRLPPGRLRLVTSPSVTGSSPMPKTTGIVAVAAFARRCRRATHRGNHGHPTANQIGRQFRQPVVLIRRETVFDRDVLALDETRFLQPRSCRRPADKCCWRRDPFRHD